MASLVGINELTFLDLNTIASSQKSSTDLHNLIISLEIKDKHRKKKIEIREMAAYAAVTPIIRYYSFILSNYDVILPPLILEAFNFEYKELKSFQIFVERLDTRSRKRMNASLGRIAEALRKCRMHTFCPRVEAEYEGLIREMHSIVEQMKKVKEEYYTLSQLEEGIASSSLFRVVPNSKMVGLREKWRLLKDELMAPWAESNVNLLAGMAGIGKTLLAREIFEDLDIMEWFDCRAWVTVGTEWISEEITEAILAQVAPEAHKMIIGSKKEMGEGLMERLKGKIMGGSKKKMVKELKEHLKGKRYFIVLDDVWNSEAHEYLESLFPDNQNGCCVLLTTRMRYVGRQATNFFNRINMRLLNEKESWDLLREKVFAGDSCPPHLEEAGKKIAEKCDGLPLTILIVADALSKAEESLWIDVAVKNKHPVFINAYDQISKVLYPSYNILDDKLKLLFLYMGAFLQKYEIPKTRLINLWIVEDFVELHGFRTLESSAANLLEFLEYSNLVIACQRDITSNLADFSGHVKSCRLHSSWWYFCQIEARKTNLFHVLDCYSEDSIEEVLEGHSRLSIHNNVLFALKHVHNSIEEICTFTVQTLLCFGPYCQYMVPVCFGLKFLCRLDALNIRFYDFPLEVLKLVKLRYLALTCNRSLPPSISDLQKLQYLIVHPHLSIKLHRAASYMPVEIWDLKELKHLEVMGYDLTYFGEKTLQKLATLSDVTTSSCTVLNGVPNLTKLRITIELTPDVVDPLCFFDHISILTKLESLKCVIVNPEWKFEVATSFPCLPLSLTKLSLSGLGYHWEEMSKIALLPNLEVLKLQCNAFQGPKWEVEENGFPCLLSLLIEDIDLVSLKWAHGSFKSLHVLKINHCFKLKEMHLGDAPDIVTIEVVDCSPLVEWLVKKNAPKIGFRDIFVRSSWRP